MNDSTHLSKNKPQYSCIFMDPLGGLKEITVPFHFALSSKNGKRARDIHLLKNLKTFLRKEEYDDEKLASEIQSVCSDLKTNEIKVQIIEMLMTNRNITPGALLLATNCFIKTLGAYGTYAFHSQHFSFRRDNSRQHLIMQSVNMSTDKEEMEAAAKTLYFLTTPLQQVIEFYKHIRAQFDCSKDHGLTTTDNDLSSRDLASILLTSEREVHRIFKLFDTINSFKCRDIKTESKVKFKENGRAFVAFLSCFEFGTPGLINIKKGVKSEKKHEIGK